MGNTSLNRLMAQLAVAVALTPVGILFFWASGEAFSAPGSILPQAISLGLICIAWLFVAWEIIQVNWRSSVV